MKKRLLIIEDEASLAKQLKWGLKEQYQITIAGAPDEARALIGSGKFPVIALDLGLPPTPDNPAEGFRLLEAIPFLSPHSKAIVITGNAEQDNAIRAIALGAVDFCAKPIDLEMLHIILERTFRTAELEGINRKLQRQAEAGYTLCNMLGISRVMQALFRLIKQASSTDYPVLITGQTGTGKEMVATAVHALSQRHDNPFVIINCGAIPENLLESELFGHEKGSFTGAIRQKIGRFEDADTGTVFLDEIGELPLALQVKLLRFLQEGTIERVGGNRTIQVDIRIIAATNLNLKAAVEEGTFREDLYHRLNVVPLAVPPLKERSEDILLLANHFLQKEADKLKRGRISLSPAATVALSAYSWPGNVRELQNRIRRALTTAKANIISPDGLGLAVTKVQAENDLQTIKEARKEAEKKAIRLALAATGNNISQAAKLIEVSRPTLHDLLKKHGIGT